MPLTATPVHTPTPTPLPLTATNASPHTATDTATWTPTPTGTAVLPTATPSGPGGSSRGIYGERHSWLELPAPLEDRQFGAEPTASGPLGQTGAGQGRGGQRPLEPSYGMVSVRGGQACLKAGPSVMRTVP